MRPPRDKLRPWRTLKSKRVFTAKPWIEVSRQNVQLPDGRVVDDYHRIELTDFVLIVAETPDHRLLILRQYRHGVGKITLSLPAGAIASNEDPLAAARRELLEETGYVASRWRKLGRFVCNANYSCGHAHIFTAKNARRVTQPKSDDLEEMELILLTRPAALRALRRGEIAALGVAAALAIAALEHKERPSKSRTHRATMRRG